MEISTNLSRLEYFRLNIYLFFRSKAIWAIGFLIWASQFYSTFASFESSGDAVCTFCALFSAFVVSTIGATLIMLVLGTIGIFASVLFANATPGVLCEHKFILKGDGLFEATEVNETLTKWKGIRAIKQYKKYIIVWIGVGIYAIPRKFFDTQEQYEEFAMELYERWKANK